MTCGENATDNARNSQLRMSEVVYSTIEEGDTGKLIAVTIPYDPSMLDTEEDRALARAIHDDIQARMREWFDEEFARNLYA